MATDNNDIKRNSSKCAEGHVESDTDVLTPKEISKLEKSMERHKVALELLGQ